MMIHVSCSTLELCGGWVSEDQDQAKGNQLKTSPGPPCHSWILHCLLICTGSGIHGRLEGWRQVFLERSKQEANQWSQDLGGTSVQYHREVQFGLQKKGEDEESWEETDPISLPGTWKEFGICFLRGMPWSRWECSKMLLDAWQLVVVGRESTEKTLGVEEGGIQVVAVLNLRSVCRIPDWKLGRSWEAYTEFQTSISKNSEAHFSANEMKSEGSQEVSLLHTGPHPLPSNHHPWDVFSTALKRAFVWQHGQDGVDGGDKANIYCEKTRKKCNLSLSIHGWYNDFLPANIFSVSFLSDWSFTVYQLSLWNILNSKGKSFYPQAGWGGAQSALQQTAKFWEVTCFILKACRMLCSASQCNCVYPSV